MSGLSAKRTLLVGVAIVLAVNAIALGGVAYNRSGKPDSVLQLSQRELHEPNVWQREKDSSGVTLHIQWRVPVRTTSANANAEALQRLSYGMSSGQPDWLDTDKLASLGFDIRPPLRSPDDSDNYDRQPRREVFLVMEFDGPAYRQSLARAQRFMATITGKDAIEEARTALLKEEQESTRLFIVDAGLDADALRAKYPDRTHYTIVRGTIRPHWSSERSGSRLLASIEELSVEAINVPRVLQPVFLNAAGQVVTPSDDAKRAPFAAVVAFGKRQEPWMMQASKVGTAPRQ